MPENNVDFYISLAAFGMSLYALLLNHSQNKILKKIHGSIERLVKLKETK